MVILGGTIYVDFLQERQRREVVEELRDIEEALAFSTLDLAQAVDAVKEGLLSPNDPTYLSNYEAEIKFFQEASSELNELVQNTDKQEITTTYLAEANRLVQVSEQILQALRAGNTEQALQLNADLRLAALDKIFREFDAQLHGEIEIARAEEESSANFLILVITLGTLVSVIVTLIAGFVISTGISQSIQGATTEIATASSEIATTMEEQERVASAQAASVNETTTTMDELEASCRQSAEQAQSAVAAAKQALVLATGGTKAVEETMEGMFVMEKKVESIAEQIIRLSEQANQIAGISSLVSELANQTNMIALNSSVEAVRAGEAGKGFAVVANEIRKLSDHSQQSAEKINALVSEIQKAVNSTVMVIDEGTKVVKGNVQVAQRMEQSFSGVAESVNKVVLNNQQVSLNLKQQVDAIQEVVKAMDTINKGARETAAGLIQTKKGTMGLNEAASTLRNLI
jgi:DNA repair exonuclease SbcCD ATPase subunit